MERIDKKRATGQRRQKRIRGKLFGTPDRPRLSVFRSHKHIYAQLIDDLAGKTLCAASSKNGEIGGELAHGGNAEAAKAVGAAIGQRAVMHGIRKAVFDRGPYKYHGRVKALADAAREAGLEF